MKILIAQIEVRITGIENAWGVTPSGDTTGRCVPVELELQSDGTAGYHLVKSPDGYFTADDWFPTLEEAQAAALEDFGVALDSWVVSTA